MSLVGALDPIFVLAITRKVLDHFVNTTWHKPADCRVEGDNISDFEFVWAHIWYRPIVTQPQLFGFGRSLRKSLNSPGPFRRRRFRCGRSSAVAEGSISLSFCSPASSNAFAAALGLRCRVGCVPDNPNSASLRIASGRETLPSWLARHRSTAVKKRS